MSLRRSSIKRNRDDFVIDNGNIRELVITYLTNKKRLPDELFYKQIGEWDVSNVTNMIGLFEIREEMVEFGDTKSLETFNEPLNDWE